MKRTQNGEQLTRLAHGGLIAALYVVLTYLSSLFGLSSGVIQCRLSEALTILPVFMPEAIPAVTVGCFLSNIFAGGEPLDIIFGTLATLIGAVGCYLLRGAAKKFPAIATLPTVLANAIIIPFVLIFAYTAGEGYFFLFLTVGAGEIISATVFGTILYYSLIKTKVFSIE